VGAGIDKPRGARANDGEKSWAAQREANIKRQVIAEIVFFIVLNLPPRETIQGPPIGEPASGESRFASFFTQGNNAPHHGFGC
jgi:hypothetical protein